MRNTAIVLAIATAFVAAPGFIQEAHAQDAMNTTGADSGLLRTHIAFLEALRGAGVPVSLAEDLDAIAAFSVLDWGERDVISTCPEPPGW